MATRAIRHRPVAVEHRSRRGRGRDRRMQTHVAHGSVVIAAITSCTNTSNPSVMLGAGLLAKKAVERGLTVKPWVKTSLAPGSRVVTDYSTQAGLMPYLEALRFHIVGYGCTTCIGNSGPLPEPVADGGQRQRPGRRGGAERQPQLRGAHPSAGAGELPGLAAAGGGLRAGRHGRHRPDDRAARRRTRTASRSTCSDIWPTHAEVASAMRASRSSPDCSAHDYAEVFEGDERWQSAAGAGAATSSTGTPTRTYVQEPPLLRRTSRRQPGRRATSSGARVLACSATRSPPTTSRRPARSQATARPAAT